ncbi:hypothetical protein SO802_023015 [Lithocarpus litseifolius]|uniref:NB-ARC domain-containing protein n=1 Tax=Lithocarpus litseifolius TaxID=425828 RepID=A0AAW2C5F3_9ROSI
MASRRNQGALSSSSTSSRRHEAEFIQDIVKVIEHKLSSTFSIDTKSLVGINFRVEKLKSQTTLARVVYDMVSNQFEACSLIANVREVYEKYGLLRLQETLMNELLMDKDMIVQDVDNGVLMIKNRLHHKKVLLILDDVNELDQMKNLAGENDWLGLGSRVIITTRDEHLLMSRKVDGVYKVEGLNCDKALHLFNMNAFGKEHPTKDYLVLSKAFVCYANGLSLAIEILGSFLFNRSIAEWESELDRLKEFFEPRILNIGIRIRIGFKVKKCGFCIVNKRDEEDFNQFMAQRGNGGITPYKGINVLDNSFGNSTVGAEGNKAKRSRDDYDGLDPVVKEDLMIYQTQIGSKGSQNL